MHIGGHAEASICRVLDIHSGEHAQACIAEWWTCSVVDMQRREKAQSRDMQRMRSKNGGHDE
jgi:hypothetical protein